MKEILECLDKIRASGLQPAYKYEKCRWVLPDLAINEMIDHTILKPDASEASVKIVCKEAVENKFTTVCVNSANIPLVAKELAGSSVKPISVVGFPLGAMLPEAKAFEAKAAISSGAKEIDMVLNIAALKDGNYSLVERDIKAVVDASRPYPVKVILETTMLNKEEKIAACILSVSAGAAFVKTSTGFAGGGATEEDITLMREIVGPNIGVKASGGVRSKEDALRMIKAGANRIGTSSGVSIMAGLKGGGGY